MSHEQNLALNVLETNLPLFHPSLMLPIEDLNLDLISTQGNVFFFDKHITTSLIPRESYWKWNQSRGKVEIEDTSKNYNVTFCKLNSRVIPPATIAPNLKIWIFNIVHTEESRRYGFFWCQKGLVEPSLDDNFLKELSFLQEFISNDNALEFGWLEPFMEKPKKKRGRKKGSGKGKTYTKRKDARDVKINVEY